MLRSRLFEFEIWTERSDEGDPSIDADDDNSLAGLDRGSVDRLGGHLFACP